MDRETYNLQKSNITYKFRIYPTTAQKIVMEKTFNCCRIIWNLMLKDSLAIFKGVHKINVKSPSSYFARHPYLKEIDGHALSNVQMDLRRSYMASFKKSKSSKKYTESYPKYKSEQAQRFSYTTNNVLGSIKLYNGNISLPNLGLVKIIVHRDIPINYKLKSVTISKDKTLNYYAALLFEYGESNEKVPKESLTHIGLDYKSDGLYMDSNGHIANMPHYYRQSQERLAKAQRALKRKKKNSQNYKKQKQKLAKLSKHVANQRKDYLHKLSDQLTEKYQLISVEDLNMKDISQNFQLGKSTTDNGYGMFLNMLEYKQRKKGHYFVLVDKYFPSSQICHNCGYKNRQALDLNNKSITCPKCGKTYDRDLNAAINIDKKGLLNTIYS